MGIRIAVLLSGSGTTLQNILDKAAAGELDVEVACVLSSRKAAYGLERARTQGVPAVAIPYKDYNDSDAFNEALWSQIRKYDVDLVVLAGFMSLLHVPPDFRNRIINVHPAPDSRLLRQGHVRPPRA